MLDWDKIVAHALSLPGTEPGSHYGQRTAKANGHAIIGPGHQPGSFVLHIDRGTKEMLIDTDPDTYWQTPHYDGWPALLVRYDSKDPERVLAMIGKARDWAMARKPNKTARRARKV